MAGFFDKIKKLAAKHDDKVDKVIRKAADEADRRTGGKYRGKIDKAAEAAQKHTRPEGTH
ncbi:antitoxin [Pilimelia terevasa]|nr:antitoxin [Pilimelia terevasa]